MFEGSSRKLRSEETWAEVRRGWERGETGASLARRYDVGLANLWRRRASENWRRRDGENDPAPEPLEGWDRYARRRLDEYQVRVEETRMLAESLAGAMTGGPLKGVPLWHVAFVLRWRAERLGPETAAEDRAYLEQYPWTAGFWNSDGRLAALEDLDAMVLDANREQWREEMGLPVGAAEGVP